LSEEGTEETAQTYDPAVIAAPAGIRTTLDLPLVSEVRLFD